MSDAPHVSVVTPAYNGEPYLATCVDSVLAQTYPHWDYTIVNNCSTDATLCIAERYAAADARIRVVTNPQFIKSIPNHNVAFRSIAPHAAYCKMVLADDWIFPDCIRQMVALGEANPRVGIVSAYGLRGDRVAWSGVPHSTNVVPGREMGRRQLLGGPYVFGTATSQLIRADVIRSRPSFYAEGNINADAEACFDVLRTWDFGFVHQILTFTRVDNGGVTAELESLRWYETAGILTNLVKYGPDYLDERELAQRLHEHLTEYYRFLGCAALRRPGADFWRRHGDRLRALGHPIDNRRLTVATIRMALDAALSLNTWPLAAAKRLSAAIAPAARNRSAGQGAA